MSLNINRFERRLCEVVWYFVTFFPAHVIQFVVLKTILMEMILMLIHAYDLIGTLQRSRGLLLPLQNAACNCQGIR